MYIIQLMAQAYSAKGNPSSSNGTLITSTNTNLRDEFSDSIIIIIIIIIIIKIMI